MSLKFKNSLSSKLILSENQLQVTNCDKKKSEWQPTNMNFSQGIHIWEFIFPVSCSLIKFGVKCETTDETYCHTPKGSTPRFITLILDVEKKELKMRINNELSTEKAVSLKSPGPFCPGVEIETYKDTVILNPFPRMTESEVRDF